MQIIILSVTGILLVSCENNVQLIEDKLRSELNEEQQKWVSGLLQQTIHIM